MTSFFISPLNHIRSGKKEIFNKLEEYSGYDLVRYLEFHYTASPDSAEFLDILSCKVSERIKLASKRTSLLSTQEWPAGIERYLEETLV